jgi:hypothetical protein
LEPGWDPGVSIFTSSERAGSTLASPFCSASANTPVWRSPL